MSAPTQPTLDVVSKAIGLASQVTPAIPVAGGAITACLKVAEGLLNLVSTAEDNKEELPALISQLNAVCSIQADGIPDAEFQQSVSLLKSKVEPTLKECDVLLQKSQKKRYTIISSSISIQIKRIKKNLYTELLQFMNGNVIALTKLIYKIDTESKEVYSLCKDIYAHY
ncbi:hypothetical protein MIND_00819900 [Mycena indigotica]|uniref:Uncharacterized protein n=1 Tax=Mycena indigotica TaxID=2126181 RepID=A0A8H6VYE4_9AGAR|nr:uncharacterized protein MIND_00819900 [Mycena indigotica]KAF7298724.1 hypothetical protein MIND_00819900 [Mycena indigotica]